MKQPQERKQKNIIVSVWYRGKKVWAMVGATKVGDNYKVSQEAINHLLDHAGVRANTTFTIG